MKLLPTHLLTRCHKISCFFFEGFPKTLLINEEAQFWPVARWQTSCISMVKYIGLKLRSNKIVEVDPLTTLTKSHQISGWQPVFSAVRVWVSAWSALETREGQDLTNHHAVFSQIDQSQALKLIIRRPLPGMGYILHPHYSASEWFIHKILCPAE